MSAKYNTAITVRFNEDVRNKLKTIASKAESSEAAIIRQAVSKFLKEYK